MLNDSQHGNLEQDEEVDPSNVVDDDRDLDYVTDEDASDVENEFVIEPNEIFDSDEQEAVGALWEKNYRNC